MCFERATETVKPLSQNWHLNKNRSGFDFTKLSGLLLLQRLKDGENSTISEAFDSSNEEESHETGPRLEKGISLAMELSSETSKLIPRVKMISFISLKTDFSLRPMQMFPVDKKSKTF
jgi:hypothetical protein